MLNTEQAERLAEYWQRRADETEALRAHVEALRAAGEPVEELGPVEEPKTMKDVRGAERAIRKLLWRLKRLGHQS
jgi:hypothetical protein